MLCIRSQTNPLKLLRRLIPPLRLGGISLDLGFLLLFVAVTIAMAVAKFLVCPADRGVAGRRTWSAAETDRNSGLTLRC